MSTHNHLSADRSLAHIDAQRFHSRHASHRHNCHIEFRTGPKYALWIEIDFVDRQGMSSQISELNKAGLGLCLGLDNMMIGEDAISAFEVETKCGAILSGSVDTSDGIAVLAGIEKLSLGSINNLPLVRWELG